MQTKKADVQPQQVARLYFKPLDAPMEQQLSTSWVSPEGVAAIATLFAVVIALFKDSILWWRKPKLIIEIKLSPPDCQKTEVFLNEKRSPCYYFRLRIKNTGKTRAEIVQVYAKRLLKESVDGEFREETRFLPMNLRWTHTGVVFSDGISPGMEQHCDLGRMVHPGNFPKPLLVPSDNACWFELNTEIKPFIESHILLPGRYHLDLIVAAANVTPICSKIELAIKDKWYDDETTMLSSSVGIKVIG